MWSRKICDYSVGTNSNRDLFVKNKAASGPHFIKKDGRIKSSIFRDITKNVRDSYKEKKMSHVSACILASTFLRMWFNAFKVQVLETGLILLPGRPFFFCACQIYTQPWLTGFTSIHAAHSVLDDVKSHNNLPIWRTTPGNDRVLMHRGTFLSSQRFDTIDSARSSRGVLARYLDLTADVWFLAVWIRKCFSFAVIDFYTMQ